MVKFRFLRTSQYDCSRCERHWEDAGELWLLPALYDTQAVWAWSVKEEDVADFCRTYSEVRWEEVKGGEFVYAMDFHAFDQWVTGKSKWEDLPLLLPFDPETHSVVKEWVEYWAGAPDPDQFGDLVADFSSPFAVLISPLGLTTDWKIKDCDWK